MTPGIVIIFGLIATCVAFYGLYLWERYDHKRWAEEAVERIWEGRDQWLKRK